MSWTASSKDPVLTVRDLHVSFNSGSDRVDALRGVSITLYQGETVGIVGESGSGKSTLAYAIMGHLGRSGTIRSGEIVFRGEDLREAGPKRFQQLRGNRISMVFQDPQTSLTPSIKIGKQIGEVLTTHLRLKGQERHDRIVELLAMVNLPNPNALMDRYPHQLSGGQKQRILIAMALACDPDLLILDEPTTGLDVTTEAVILDLIGELKERVNASILYISHNLGVIARVCDRVAVAYAGELVETSEVGNLFDSPRHPYTLGLLGCVPRLGISKGDAPLMPIPGRIPSSSELPRGCVFEPRCPYSRESCTQSRPEMFEASVNHWSRCFFWDEVDKTTSRFGDIELHTTHASSSQAKSGLPLLLVNDLKKHYESTEGGFLFFGRKTRVVKAVDGVDLMIHRGETLALVGESGCGKTTISRCIVGLVDRTAGDLAVDGEQLQERAERRPIRTRRKLQMVFQNPESSLNPRQTVRTALERPLSLLTDLSQDERQSRVYELLELVNLDPRHADRYPRQLSGGEKQRVGIARAFASNPDLVLCDEPVSSLDVSVQAAILNLIARLQTELGTSYLFVAHDLAVVRYLADRIAVIYLGHIVESGTSEEVFAPPYHPYTEALLSAIPVPDPHINQKSIRLEGPVPDPANPPSGCPFHTRCPRKIGRVCEEEIPPVQIDSSEHSIWCHIPIEELRQVDPIVGGADAMSAADE